MVMAFQHRLMAFKLSQNRLEIKMRRETTIDDTEQKSMNPLY